MAEYLKESPLTMSDKIKRFMFDNIGNRNRANYYANKATGLLDLTGATLGEDAGRMVGEGAANKSLLGVGQGLGLLALGTIDPTQGKIANAAKAGIKKVEGLFDPRFDDRVREQTKLKNIKPKIQPNNTQENIPQISLTDLEGKPFITTMSDRTRADGLLTGINDVNFNYPVDMLGGQGYMFRFPNQQWASGELPVRQMDELAKVIKQKTGQNPIHIPWRMSPTGGDFSHMTGETMLAYADAAMPLKQKKNVDKLIKTYIPDWKGMSDPSSVMQYSEAPDKVRKLIQRNVDKQFRELGGLGRGEARLAVADPNQLTARDGGLLNVGEIFADSDVLYKPTQHRSYPYVLQGKGIGQVKTDKNIYELLDIDKRIQTDAKGKPTGKILDIDKKNPTRPDLRALEMKPYFGTITEGLLKKLGY